MTVGDRFKSWIEGLADSWGDRLRGWMVGWAARGLKSGLEDMEPGAIAGARDMLLKLKSDPNLTPEMKALIDKMLTPGNPFLIAGGVIVALAYLLGTINAAIAPVNRLVEQQVDQLVRSFRFDPMSVITAWRRDPAKYEELLGDLRDLGWSPERIETLKFITEFLPSPRDLVEWEAKEVFEPNMIAKYGLADEFETLDLSLFAKVGVTEEQARNFWIAHWEHASWNQVVEMLHRGQLKEEDVWDWFRLVEIPPFWRQKLINISWNVPTRVDVRRFWDMRTINEARLREIYTSLGYHGKDLDDYVLWTKIYVDLPDLITRFKNGWLDLDGLRSELKKVGLKEDRIEELIQTKIKAAASEKLAKDKDLTAAEIIKGVKKEIITWNDGLELLQDMGYDEWEAEFKLAIEVAVATGSPESYAEFKDLTQKWRKATGQEVKPMTEEIKKLGAEVVRLSAEVSALEKSIKDEQAKLLPDTVVPAEATARVKELQASLYRAQTELARVKTDYNAKVAEWRHASK